MQSENAHRLREIDFLRGIAIALMVFTHTAMYFYDFSDQVFTRLSDLGGEICLSIFLFCSGYVLPNLFIRYGNTKGSLKMAKRAVQMFAIYLLFGVVLSGPQNIWNLLMLQNIPAFADFTLAFAIFFLLAAFLGEFIHSKQRALWGLVIALVLYLVGYALYGLAVPEYLLPIKALLVGDGELHRFPILQYSFIYMLGVNYHFWHERLRIRDLAALAAVTVSVTYLSSFLGFERWSVSPSFLANSFAAIAILLLIWHGLERFHPHLPALAQRIKNWLVEQLLHYSKHALNILLLHILILTLLSQADIPKLHGILLLVAYLIILPSSSWLSSRMDHLI